MRRARARSDLSRLEVGIPLYPCAERAEGMLVNFEPIDFLKRPAPLMHVQGAYAVLGDGSAMVPALEPGDTALINPRLFPRKNMSALFLEASEESVRGAFRRYEGQSERVWRVSNGNPTLRDIGAIGVASRPRGRWEIQLAMKLDCKAQPQGRNRWRINPSERGRSPPVAFAIRFSGAAGRQLAQAAARIRTAQI